MNYSLRLQQIDPEKNAKMKTSLKTAIKTQWNQRTRYILLVVLNESEIYVKPLCMFRSRMNWNKRHASQLKKLNIGLGDQIVRFSDSFGIFDGNLDQKFKKKIQAALGTQKNVKLNNCMPNCAKRLVS